MEQIKEVIKKFDEKRKKEDEEQKKFYQWAENLAKEKGLTPMTPEEIALLKINPGVEKI
jgi:hypothetical protein